MTEIKSILLQNKLSKNVRVTLAPKGFSVNENSNTFIGNAAKKAKTLSKKLKVYAFSDDSGIEVFSLGRKPGIKSARFFRKGKGLLEIVEKVKHKKNKKCCFTCAIVFSSPSGEVLFKTQKSWFGKVSEKPKGKNGFGYDPIFVIPEINKTSAQISSGLKNKISHRGLAVASFVRWLNKSYKHLTK